MKLIFNHTETTHYTIVIIPSNTGLTSSYSTKNIRRQIIINLKKLRNMAGIDCSCLA